VRRLTFRFSHLGPLLRRSQPISPGRLWGQASPGREALVPSVKVALLLAAALVVSSCASTASVDVFDFSEDDLCERFTAEEITAIVAQAYDEHAASPVPPAFEEAVGDSQYADLGCWWNSNNQGDRLSVVGLLAVNEAPIEKNFEPHLALSDGVRVHGLGEPEVGSHDDYVPGVEVRLWVDGQDQVLEFWHMVPPGFDGDAHAVLGIADQILEEMGWLSE